MRIAAVILALLFAPPALAQTVTLTEAQVAVTFYVKEGTASPYQGRLQYRFTEYPKIKIEDVRAAALEQYAAWKKATAEAQAVQARELTVDEKAAQAEALIAQADDIARQIEAIKADPEVAAKLESK